MSLKFLATNSARLALLLFFFGVAVTIRLIAVQKYGRVIHEFDPWFNYRATEYLARNGYSKFVDWYDYESWSPIGRPVGTTVYPGMMLTAANLWHLFNYLDLGISINDVCVFIPAGFSVLSCLFIFLLAWEVTGNANAAVASTGIMAILPAHLMRSVAGGFDNESVAIAAMCSTFFLWTRSLRTPSSWLWAPLTGLSYIYMVAAWGAYPFVLNMIGMHCGFLVVLNFFRNTFDHNLHRAYSIFFVIGTWGALQFPVVGVQPLRSMEQMAPMALFFLLQFLCFLDYARTKYQMDDRTFKAFRIKAFLVGAAVGALILAFVVPTGYFGPLGARIRGLFVPHTKTGNPLVDSVAEHQATPNEAYWRYFHIVSLLAPIGVFACLSNPTPARWFLFWYALTAAYFSRKMIRLVLLLAPAASIGAGWALIILAEWCFDIFYQYFSGPSATPKPTTPTAAAAASVAKPSTPVKSSTKVKRPSSSISADESLGSSFASWWSQQKFLRLSLAALIIAVLMVTLFNGNFISHCFNMANQLSEPQIIIQGRTREGKPIMIDDFREAYWWLRDNTPADSRVMAWWDYGYQINGIGNRTTIADGNTWNHEHIALLGKCLVSPEDKAHSMIRHLADYVLVWSTRWGGMWGDDLAKMPHMARIAGSVYFDVDPHGYYMDQSGQVSEKMRRSLLFLLHSYRLDPSVPEPKHFREVYTSTNHMVRIYAVKNVSQRSKAFGAANHTYPPALDEILAQKKDFQRDREKHFL